MQFSGRYILIFSTLLCFGCAIAVSTLAVMLEEKQEINRLLDKRTKVLEAAGLVEVGDKPTEEEVDAFFERITSVVVNLETGEIAEDIDPEIFDQRKAQKDPATSQVAPDNNAGINRIPDHAVVFQVFDDQNALDMVILPVEGYGLWGTLYGFIALSSDFQTVRGLTYYEHKETPGLGGEVDNPRWKGLWPGRKIFGEDGMPEIEVIKGAAGPVADAPYEVDGLSGATITSRGITNMLHFWLGEQGFGAYLDKLRASTESTQRRAA